MQQADRDTTRVVYSMWAASYAIVEGVEIVGTVTGNYGRTGWILDNADGKAQRVLDDWHRGVAVVNARALLDQHSRLMDEVRQLA